MSYRNLLRFNLLAFLALLLCAGAAAAEPQADRVNAPYADDLFEVRVVNGEARLVPKNFTIVLPSGPGGLTNPGGGVGAPCKKCTAHCQTLVIAGGSDIWWDSDIGATDSEADCKSQAQDKCNEGYLTVMDSYTCEPYPPS